MKNWTRILKKSVAAVVALTLGTTASQAQDSANDYEQLWKEVTQFQEKGQPKSAIEVAEKIYKRAEKDANFGQQLKAGLSIMAMRQDISVDSVVVDVKKLEALPLLQAPQAGEDSQTKVKRALANVLIASVYQQMGRTRLVRQNDEARDEYLQKVDNYVQAALAEKQALVGVSAEAYAPLYRSAQDSRFYNNDALSLIIDFLESQGMLGAEERWQLRCWSAEAYQQAGMREAYILQKLEALKQQYGLRKKSLKLSHKDYVAELKNLYEANIDTEAGAEAAYTYLRNATGLTIQQRYDMAEELKGKWENSSSKTRFQRLQELYLSPSVSIDFVGPKVANQPFQVVIHHSNVKSVQLVTTVDKDSKLMKDFDKSLLPKPIELNFDYQEGTPEGSKTDTITMTLPAGYFSIQAISGKFSSYEHDVHLSSIQLMCLGIPGEGSVACVVDAITGKPVPNCKVIGTWEVRENDKWVTKTETYTTDAQGQAHLSSNVETAQACLTKFDETKSISASYSVSEIKETKEEIRYEVYTDRAIYRPGQTIYVSGFAYRQKDEKTQAVPNKEVTIKFFDANYQEIASQNVTTDEFGAAACNFTIPTDRLNGQFQVRFGNGSNYVRVEEYKRPTYTVEFEPVTTNFALGDTVDIHGVAKTYSGVPVQGATVKFTTSKGESTFWSWWHNSVKWEETANGEVTTDEDGRFTIRTVLQNENDAELLLFRTNADVTDQAGESHSATTTLRISKQEFGINISMGSNIEAESKKDATITITAFNAQGKPVEATGTWRVLSYNRNERDYTTEIANGTFTANQEFTLPSFARFPLGSYRIEALAIDGKQNEIKAKDEFVLWSSKRKEEMNLKEDWIYVPSYDFNEEKPVDIWFASAESDAYTYLYIASYNQLVKKSIGTRSPVISHERITYSDEFRNGAAFIYAYVKNAENHKKSTTFSYRAPEKSLKLTWKTFRDKLIPGQQETWTLSILDQDGKPVPAQLLTTMYDASLEAFASHSLPFYIYHYRYSPDLRYSYANIQRSGYTTIRFNTVSLYDIHHSFNTLRPYSHYVDLYREARYTQRDGKRLARAAGGAVLSSPVYNMVEEAPAPVLMQKAVNSDSAEAEKNAATPEADEQQPETNKIRENFNETAYFYHNLLTDKDGCVTISFTLPESLTKWNVLGLAHTKDMNYGHIKSSVTASKDFMVQPNMPRFVRMGDRISIPTRIINQSEKAVKGTATVRLIDPETEAVIHTADLSFSVEAGKTTSVSFAYEVPETYPMLICEVTGTDGTFSDGERNWLPVLTDKKYITETVPFYFVGAETSKDIDLSTLFNNNSETATQRSMTFEYTDNPSWTAVLALHSVVNPENDNTIAWSAALYANRVAQHLASRMPRLQELIQKWNAETGNETTLQSELEKNQELKEILLKETPWVLDAQQETQQRKMICQLFDKKLLDQRIEQATAKLRKWQFSNGGWGWYEGMKHNYYTTLACSRHLALLNNYLTAQGIEDKTIQKMLHNGIKYLDDVELRDYNKYYKKHKKILPAESTYDYLYLKAISNADTDSKSVANMKKDYLNRIEKNINAHTMYGRAHTAVILLTNGRQKSGLQFVRSLREYTVQKAGMGRYYDTEKAYYSWRDYKIPTHIAAMKAMKFTQADFADSQDYLIQMQLWLLRQKQVQTWDNEMNTIAAVDLLLSISPETTFHEVRTPVVRMGNSPLTLNEQTAGIGYTKTPVPADIVAAQPQTVHVTVPAIEADSTSINAAISWGCVYGQCLEKQSKLKGTEGELKIERKTYVQRVLDGQTQWVPLAEGEALTVGDKVRIRHIVTADRDMDFVQVRSQHAACLEPLRTLSGYQQMGGRGCYLVLHDASADLLFDYFTKGTATLDLDLYVTHEGTYQQGVATIQCAYSPAFSGHSSGETLQVKAKQ